MREFKFRAWAPKSKKMCHAFNNTPAEIFTALEKWEDNVPIVMQYTGLKDSTPWEKATRIQREGYTKGTWEGVEIYEGDIVHNGTEKFIVDWIAPKFEMKFIGTEFEQWAGELLDGNDGIEVIGNIYENKELC